MNLVAMNLVGVLVDVWVSWGFVAHLCILLASRQMSMHIFEILCTGMYSGVKFSMSTHANSCSTSVRVCTRAHARACVCWCVRVLFDCMQVWSACIPILFHLFCSLELHFNILQS